MVKKKSRMLSIRLSDDEFSHLRQVCESTGSRSLSDLAREAMHRMVADDTRTTNGLETHIRELDSLLTRLRSEVARLAEIQVTEGR